MSAKSASLMASHGRLWYDDPIYRASWIIAPQCVVLVLLAWIFGAAPINLSVPWGKPAAAPTVTEEEMKSLHDQANTDREAMTKLERIAATGEGISNYYLGTLYDPAFKTSKLVSPDLDKSISYYQTATNAGISKAQEFLMDFYWIPKFGRPDVPKACDIGVKSAAPPTGQVLREVGYCYVDGWGTTKPDLVKAVAAFRAASEKGDARATADLGYYYQSGQGNLPRDGDMAVKLYKQAADQKDLLGIYNLGACYETGCGTLPKNTVEAARLVASALDGKLDIAINILTTRSSVFSAQFWQELQRQLIKRNVYTGPIDGTPNATLMAAIKHMGTAN